MEQHKTKEFNLDTWVKQHQLDNENYKINILSEDQAQKLTNDLASELSNKSQACKDRVIEKIYQNYAKGYDFECCKALTIGAVLTGAQTNFYDKDRCYNKPLVEAAFFNDLKFAEFLLGKGANPRAFDNSSPNEVIFFAKTVKMAELLIAHGAIPAKAVGASDDNLLGRVIVMKLPLELLNLYLQHGVDPNPKNCLLHTLVDKRLTWKQEHILKAIKMLLEHGARTDTKNGDDLTPAENAFSKAKLMGLYPTDITQSLVKEREEWKENYITLGRCILRSNFDRIMQNSTTYLPNLPKDLHNHIFEYIAISVYRETKVKPPQIN